MPIVNIRMAKGRSLEQKRRLVKAVTDAVARTVDSRPEWITVLVEELDRQNWATGGELHIDKFGTGFGTNGRLDENGP